MSALLLASASSDVSSSGSHATTQARTTSSPGSLSDTAAFALKSFLLDEEIRLQQQRLQHMLHLRQQQVQEQGYAQLEQEIQYKHLILQQRLLTLTLDQQLKEQTSTSRVFQLPYGAGNLRGLPVATSDNDASLCIEREHPLHVLQRTDEQLSVSQLQPVENSNVECSASFIAEGADSLAQHRPLQRQAFSQPRWVSPALKQGRLQQPPRQHHAQGAAPQHCDVELPTLQHRNQEQSEGEHPLSSSEQSFDVGARRQQVAERDVPQEHAQQDAGGAAVAGCFGPTAPLETPSERFAFTGSEADLPGENTASAPGVNAFSSVPCGTVQAGAATVRDASPSCSAPSVSQGEVRAQSEAGQGVHRGPGLLQGDSVTRQRESAVGDGAPLVGGANPPALLHVSGLEDEANSKSMSSRDAASVDPLASASTTSFAALDQAPGSVAVQKHQEQHQEQMAPRRCFRTCGDLATSDWSREPFLPEERCLTERILTITPDDETSAEPMRIAQSADAPTAEQATPCLQTEMQNAQVSFATSSCRQSGGSPHSMDNPHVAWTARACGELYQSAPDDGGRADEANAPGDDHEVAAMDASSEQDLLHRGNTSFARLDLSGAVLQQLRSSHIARGTESAAVEEVEEALRKSLTHQDHYLPQPREHACGSVDGETQGHLTRTSEERCGERRSDDSSSCAISNSKALTSSKSMRGSGNGEDHEDSEAAQLQRLAEKLREQEAEKRLMQEESFQLEQMLKRQYFQDIQRKEAEKEELQHQLTHIQQLGNSLKQRLTDVTQQKNKLYDIVLLAQDALAEAVASTPWSSGRLTPSRGKRVSPRASGRATSRVDSFAGGATASETCRALAPQGVAEEMNDVDHSHAAEEGVLSEEDREEEEALKKLLASREEVSHTLTTLVNKLKHAIEALGTHGLARDEEAALSASLRRAVVACNRNEGQKASASALSKQSEVIPQTPCDLPSDDSKTNSPQGNDSIDSDEDKDGETTRQLRQLQEEVNVLRKNLRSFTDAVLATQRQPSAAAGKVGESGSGTHITPEKEVQASASASAESREMLPPQKLTLQRLEDLQRLNAKLLLDNTQLHRLCAQQIANSLGASASNVCRPSIVAYPISAALSGVTKQTATSGLRPVEGSPSNQRVRHMAQDAVQSNFLSFKDKAPLVRSAVAASPGVLEVGASFSPVSAASPATSSSVAPRHVPYCVAVSSPLINHTSTSFFPYSGRGAHNLAGNRIAGSTAEAPAVVGASGAVVGQSYNAAHTKRPSFTEGGRTTPAVDAREICSSANSRCTSPQLLPALRRELWQSTGVPPPMTRLESAHPYHKEEHAYMQAGGRQEGPQRVHRRFNPNPARLHEQETLHVCESTQQAYVQQTSPEAPIRIFQQPLLFQTSGEQPPRVVRLVDTAAPSLPLRPDVVESAKEPQAYSAQHFERHRVQVQRGRQAGTAPSAAYSAAPAAAARAFPRLPRYSKGGRPQGTQQETASRPAITPSSSTTRLPLLPCFASGSSAPQAQRQRLRALSSAGSSVDRKLPITQSLTLLRQGNPAAQSQRKLHSRSHSHLFVGEDDNPSLGASVPPAVMYRGLSPLSTENCARIDLTVWGQRVVREEKKQIRGPANAAVAAGRALESAAVRGRQSTDGIPAKVFLRTRRASAVANADHLPALTPAHSDSRLLATSEDRHKRQQRGSCTLGRCWLGFSPAVGKTSEATHHVPLASNRRLRPARAVACIQPPSSETEEITRLRLFSPVSSFARFAKDYMSRPGSGLPTRDLTEGVYPRGNPTVPLSPSRGPAPARNNSSFAVNTSPVVVPLHNSGMSYARTLPSSMPAVGLTCVSHIPSSRGPSPGSSPSAAAPAAVNTSAALHAGSVCVPPPQSAGSPYLNNSSQIVYDKARQLNFCRESVVSQPHLTTCCIGEPPEATNVVSAGAAVGGYVQVRPQ